MFGKCSSLSGGKKAKRKRKGKFSPNNG